MSLAQAIIGDLRCRCSPFISLERKRRVDATNGGRDAIVSGAEMSVWRDEVTYVCTLIVTAITIANAMRERRISFVPSFLKKKHEEASTKDAPKKNNSARSLLRDLAIRWAIVHLFRKKLATAVKTRTPRPTAGADAGAHGISITCKPRSLRLRCLQRASASSKSYAVNSIHQRASSQK